MDPRPLAVIVGENVRKLRTAGGHSGEALARELPELFQVRWTTGRISELENGRVSPTAPTLFMVSQALTQLLSRPVAVAELFADDGFAEVGQVGIRTTRVADAFDGQVVELANSDGLMGAARDHHAKMSADLASIPTAGKQPLELLMQIEKDSGEAEDRAANALGLRPLHLAALSAALWGRTYSQERNQRAGAEASPQKRGRIGRELRAELKEAASNGDD